MVQTDSIPGDGLVSAEWLAENVDSPKLQVVDIRGYVHTENLGGGRQKSSYIGARDEFLASHIPGAAFIDWTKDIVDADSSVPVQIASPEVFSAALGQAGVDADTDVVVVDHAGGHFATRLWWALEYYGHERVSILDGGFNRWQSLGLPTESGTHVPVSKTFVAKERPELWSGPGDVLDSIETGERQIVDARDPETFSGALQRGARGGHIPTARNLSAKELFEADGRWKEPDKIRAVALEAGIDFDRPVTAYCNGGVTATAVLFGLQRAGLADISNYDGSWNEWGEREDLPVEGNRDLWKES